MNYKKIYDSIINNRIKNIIKEIEDQRSEDFKKYYQLKNKALGELNKSKTELLKIITENEIQNEKVQMSEDPILKRKKRKT